MKKACQMCWKALDHEQMQRAWCTLSARGSTAPATHPSIVVLCVILLIKCFGKNATTRTPRGKAYRLIVRH